MRKLNNGILLIFLFTSTLNNAQEREYVVTNNNDTIYGKVTRSSSLINPSKIKFKIKDDKGQKNIFKPSEIKLVRSIKGIDGNSIIVTIYDRWFLKRIINGKIKVYLLLDGALFFVSKNNFKIKSTDIGGFFSRKKAHSQIRPLIEDNLNILNEFDLLEGSEKNILYIIEKYNQYSN
jgi:hypothetical protein